MGSRAELLQSSIVVAANNHLVAAALLSKPGIE
eukprot:CAMPEP_0197684470 /NCGR_PEP_ID=MMETSP1338-20131121/99538_1 /TAXON_ID=43686 ORGANISM="Pelagodinium beii, Strain RCC1491" /NCGR_SAMPLE_ID=MMETSP1338 /ASSEMBLY_ACC=CAM_ASM_000754 /LENGTH=32 /DNA_ID= /DNA_START= /DNA_END= /DNA_ORIENTATION=